MERSSPARRPSTTWPPTGATTTRAQPSNDVFRVTLTFEGGLGPEEARAGLAVALDGHRYAWRIEERADSTLIHLVTVAAGARRDEYGKKERIYANEKSVDRFHDKIEDAFGRDVDLSAPVWAHGVEGATTQLAALTKAARFLRRPTPA